MPVLRLPLLPTATGKQHWGNLPGAALSLAIAEEASARYGWPLHVVEDAGHFAIERPEAFGAALAAALGR